MTKYFLIAMMVLAVLSCKRKTADEYEYYDQSVKDSLAEQLDTIAEVVEKVVEEPKKPVIKAFDENDRYFIVVSSYTVEEFATAQKKELEAQGYQPGVIMTDDDGWFKLAVSSYPKYSEAEKALAHLQKKGGIFNQARIVFKKSK